MDLLHVYSKQSGGIPPVQSLVEKAQESTPRISSARAVKRARQLRPEEIDVLVTQYRENGSVVAAAKEVGVSRQTAGKHLAEAGIVTVRRIGDPDIAIARELREAGQSYASIGRRLGFSTNTVRKALGQAWRS